MAKAKALLTNTVSGEVITAQFNPTGIRRQKGVNWAEVRIPGLNFPKLHFVAGNAREIPLTLEFDSEGQEDVSSIAQGFERLVAIDRRTGAPPLTRFVWGPQAFEAVVTDLAVEYDDFTEDGTPTSCTVNLTLKEYQEAEVIVQTSTRAEAEPTQYTVRQGDTLSSIAQTVYGDSSKWRQIASANSIADPRRIRPGTALVLPPKSEVMA